MSKLINNLPSELEIASQFVCWQIKFSKIFVLDKLIVKTSLNFIIRAPDKFKKDNSDLHDLL